jgi:hypothetical protein
MMLTGILQWALRIGNVGETFDSGYGQSLVAKTLLLLPMLALGATNLLLISPRLRKLVAGLDIGPGVRHLTGLFGRSIALEATLGLTVLVATGFLTDTSPPAVSAAHLPAMAIVASKRVDDLEVRMTVDPGVAGPNRISFRLDDKRGPKEEVHDFIVRFTYLDQDLGQTEDRAMLAPDGSYELSGLHLALPGRWQVLIVVQRQNADDARATFEVNVGPP